MAIRRQVQATWARLGLATVALALLAGSGGCTAKRRGANGADPQRQSDAEYDLAREALYKNDPRTALGHAQKAVEYDEDNADAQHMVALVYLFFCATSPEECRLPAAETAARKALRIREDFREARNTLGVVLIHEKKYADAIGVLKTLTGDMLYQTPWDAWGNLGQAYLEKGDVDEAVGALKRSVAAQPKYCVANYRLGLAYEKKGDLSAAREALTRALETDDPKCRALQDAWEARARVHQKSNRCKEARDDWGRCKQLAADSPTGQRCSTALLGGSC